MPEQHFIFPLGTVLFPGGALPLKIFEQRYIEMTKACLRDNRPFGVCLIREGAEVGNPAVPERVGCLASIEQWDMPQLGVFHVLARGGDRFRLLETTVATNGLMSGSVERMLTDDTDAPLDTACRDVLKVLVEHLGEANFPSPLRLDDPTWVSYRLAEVLPLDLRSKQALLEIEGTEERLNRLRQVLAKEGLVNGNA